MNPYVRPVARLTVLAILLVSSLLLTGCQPHEGDSCPSEGSYSTHTDNGHRTSLSCINGRWRKV